MNGKFYSIVFIFKPSGQTKLDALKHLLRKWLEMVVKWKWMINIDKETVCFYDEKQHLQANEIAH